MATLTPKDLTLPKPSLVGKLTPGQQYSQQASQGQTYFSDPNLAKAMSSLLGGIASDTGSQYSNFLSNPAGSPLFQNALSGLLGSLQPSENAARMNLNDQFRAAGNTASSTFGQKAMGLESELLRNRQTLSSDLLTKLFPQMAEALYKPVGQIPSLLDATKLQQNQSAGLSGGVTGSGSTGQVTGAGPVGGFYSDTGIGAQRGGAGTLMPQYQYGSGPA